MKSIFAACFSIALLVPAFEAAADDAPAAQRQVAQRPSGSSSSASSSRGAASSRPSASAQSGGAGRTRPGGSGGGDRGVAVRPPSSGRGGGGFRSGHHFGHHGYYGHRHGLGYYGYLGFGYYGYPYWGYYYPRYYPAPLWYYSRISDSMGALDLNVKPKNAEVYLDGQWIGRVRAFDGYPGFLWLEEGTHEVVIYKPGYETLHETVRILPGVVIDFRRRLGPGESTPPEEIVPPPAPPAYEEDRSAESVPQEAAPPSVGRSVDLSMEPARLHLTVDPADASVYLDGRFLGTGADLARLRAGLMVNAGEHHVSVVRPSYKAEELHIEVTAGEDVELAVRLHPEGS